MTREQISEQEVLEVLDYAVTMYQAYSQANNGINGSDLYYSSSTEHDNLVGLSPNSTTPTHQSIRSALAKYKDNEDILVEYNQFMAQWDGIFNRVIRHYTSLLAFDVSYYCINAQKSDYKTDEYRQDVKRNHRFFEDFAFKYEANKILKHVLLNDTNFTWLRDSEGSINDDEEVNVTRRRKKTLQQLPQKECLITGQNADGFLFDFNLNYFNNSTVNIQHYDPSLIRAYRDKNKSVKDSDATYQYDSSSYVRTSMKDGAWVWKFNNEDYNTLPPFSYLLKSVFNNDTIEKLQRDKDMISASAIILGEIKTKENDKSANDKDPFVINPKTLGNLMRLARNGINRNIKQIPLPTEDNKLFQFQDNNSNMLNNQLTTSASLGASASSLIYSTSNMAQFAMQSALIEDYKFVSKIYYQFEKFLNYYVNKKTKKFKFSFKVSGSTLPFLRKEEFEKYIKLSDKGIQPNVSKWASLLGVMPNELHSMMEEVSGGDMIDNLVLLMNTNTKDDGTGETNTGRPQTDTESSNITKDYS